MEPEGVNPNWLMETLYNRPITIPKQNESNHQAMEDASPQNESVQSTSYIAGNDPEHGSLVPSQTRYKDSSMLRLPFLGRVHYVYDVQGFMQIGFIVYYWIYGSSTSLFVILLPMYQDGHVPLLLVLFYCCISICCIISLFRANTMNPGRVTESLTLQYNEAERDYCKTCMTERPPRSHHCRRCRHCVLKMDHHCPWINNCVGEENQHMFILLLFYAVTLSVSTLSLDLMYFYYFPECQSCDKDSFFISHKSGLVMVASIMAVAMICFAGALFVMQYVNLVMDMTSLDWMKLQAELRVHFDVKKLPKAKRRGLQGMQEAFGRGNKFLWLLPCRKRGPPALSGQENQLV